MIITFAKLRRALGMPRQGAGIAGILLLLALFGGFRMAASELPPLEVIDSTGPAYVRDRQVAAESRHLVKEGDTAGLEKLAAALRSSREAGEAGTWMLSTFYETATQLPNEDAEVAGAMEFFERWAGERPESITAQVCLARALTSHAWKARGSGWANSVTEEGWKLFGERLARASDVLGRASRIEEKCPGWYEAAQRVALGQGWDRDKYFAMVGEALRNEPGYGKYYTNAFYWLLPRWYGEAGDFEKWLTSQANARPPDQRDLEYARLVWLADRMNMPAEMVFSRNRLDWERTRRGFREWLARQPGNLSIRFEFLRLALLANDRATAREQFDATGGKYFPPLWNHKVEQFEAARQFAYADGTNPLLTSRRERPRQISPEAAKAIALAAKLIAGFTGGFLAGVLLLSLGWDRRAQWESVAALLVCVVGATVLGTAFTIIPAGIFYFLLRRKPPMSTPRFSPIPGWATLLLVGGVAALDLVLQVAASILAMVPLYLEAPSAGVEAIRRFMRSDGAWLVFINSAWISLLVLLAVIRPNKYRDWRELLGLRIPAPVAALWTILAVLVVWGMSVSTDWLMDERSKESLRLMAEGVHSPVFFFLALVIAAPAFEELLYRGFAYSAWVTKIGFWGTALATSAIFAATHIQYGWMGLASIFAFGIILSGLRWKTGSVYPCILVHMGNNLVHYALI